MIILSTNYNINEVKLLKIFTSEELTEFESVVQSKLPKYIRVNVTQNTDSGYIFTKLIFPDDHSGTTYVYCPNEDTVLDDDFAIHALKNALNIAVINLTSHLKLLSNLMGSL